MKIFQKGFNYSQDGQGNRLVIHMQGCNMRCPWCANPEGLSMQGTLVTDEKWLDPSLCPYGAITAIAEAGRIAEESRATKAAVTAEETKNAEAVRTAEGSKITETSGNADKTKTTENTKTEKTGWKLDRAICSCCQSRECVTRKRSKGIRNSCMEVSEEKLLREIISSSMMFYDGGGVTFTGGECTMQSEELMGLLKELTEKKIHTALETNGTYRDLPKLFPYISQLIMDCKLIDEEKHRRWTGVSNVIVQENLRSAARSHPCVHIRVPLIGGVNNAPEEIDRFIVFFRELQNIHDRENPTGQLTFEVLKYHEYGKKKWMECGWDYQMTDEARVSVQEVNDFKSRIKEAGLNYKRT